MNLDTTEVVRVCCEGTDVTCSFNNIISTCVLFHLVSLFLTELVLKLSNYELQVALNIVNIFESI